MISEFGYNYEIFDRIGFLPLEIQRLLDIFSINHNYILQNGFMKEDFIEDLRAAGAITPQEEIYSESIFDLDVQSMDDIVPARMLGRYETVSLGSEIGEIPQLSGASVNAVSLQTFANDIYRAYLVSGGQDETGVAFCSQDGIFAYSAWDGISADNYTKIPFGPQIPDFLSGSQVDSRLVDDLSGSLLMARRIPSLTERGMRFNPDMYLEYAKNTFYDLIVGFLEMKYNDERDTSIKDSLSPEDPYFMFQKNGYPKTEDDDIDRVKKSYGIEDFDQSGIVDRIDAGTDFLYNYSGVYLEVLEMEIAKRARTLDMSRYDDGKPFGYQPQTRYSYYRKAKVIEYAEFIDRKMYERDLDPETYDIDGNYMIVSGNHLSSQVIDFQTRSIDTGMVEDVANKLANVALYIEKLRELIKIQTRKNYMKGTENLVRIVVRDFIHDYMTRFAQDSITTNLDGMDVKVQEYFDNTEYFNLSSETSDKSISRYRSKVNQPFFEEYFSQDSSGRIIPKNDPLQFTDDEITSFYHDILGVGGDLPGISSLDQTQRVYQFLSVTYKTGRQNAYMSDRGVVQCMLQDERFTQELTSRLSILQENLSAMDELLLSGGDGFQYNEDTTLSDQKLSVLGYISGYYSEWELSGVSATYDEYYPMMVQLSIDTDQVSSATDQFISGEYMSYFAKSDYDYCYNWSGTERGDYKHAYFIGSPDIFYTYLHEKIQQLQEYCSISTNIMNWEIYDTVSVLFNGFQDQFYGYLDLRDNLYTNVIQILSGYGYTVLGTENLDSEIDAAKQFVESKINLRLTYLTNSLQQMISQAKDAEAMITQANNTLNSVLQLYPNFSQGWCMVVGGGGGYAITTDASKADLVDNISGKMFKSSSKKKAIFSQYTIPNQDVEFQDGDSITTKVQKLMGGVNIPNCYYGEHTPPWTTIKNSLKSIQADVVNVRTKYDSINEQAFRLFGKRYVDNSVTDDITIENLENLIAWLNAEITEKEFQNDATIIIYNQVKASVLSVEEQHNITKEIYLGIRNKPSQGMYLADFDFVNDFTPTNLYRLSAFAVRKDT